MSDILASRLLPLRERIDAIDEELLQLLNERARIAQQVGKVKEDFDVDGPVLKPEREAQILRRLKSINDGPFTEDAIAAVWGEIISTCRGLEEVLSVAYLGPQGSFSEQASYEQFGHYIKSVLCDSFDEVFQSVESGQTDVGVVPVENSTEGSVNRTLDLLLNSPLKVLGERSLKVNHELLSKSSDMQGVTRIMAHPQALAQCQGWLLKHYPNVIFDAAASNAQAAAIAAQDPSVAAISSKSAAKIYDLNVIASGIQDYSQNRTRFLVIGNDEPSPSGCDKTSLILAVPNKAGALYDMLAPLAKHGVSMTRLESRPARTGQWEYYFYLDVLGHRRDENVSTALKELQQKVAFIKILGSYPRQ